MECPSLVLVSCEPEGSAGESPGLTDGSPAELGPDSWPGEADGADGVAGACEVAEVTGAAMVAAAGEMAGAGQVEAAVGDVAAAGWVLAADEAPVRVALLAGAWGGAPARVGSLPVAGAPAVAGIPAVAGASAFA